MAYPRKVKKPDSNQAAHPTVNPPGTQPVTAPQAKRPAGGAPKVNADDTAIVTRGTTRVPLQGQETPPPVIVGPGEPPPVVVGPGTPPQPQEWGREQWKDLTPEEQQAAKEYRYQRGGYHSMRSWWAQRQAEPGEPPLAPSPFPLQTINQDYGALVTAVKEQVQAQIEAAPPEQTNSYFYHAFRQYPNEVSQLMVRRLMTNHLVRQGEAAQWIDWLNRNRRR